MKEKRSQQQVHITRLVRNKDQEDCSPHTQAARWHVPPGIYGSTYQ